MAEPKDFINVEEPNFREEVVKQIRESETLYHRAKKPFDRSGALNDFDDYCDQYRKEVERAVSRKQAVPEFKKNWDWSEYADKARFDKDPRGFETDAINKYKFRAPEKIGIHRNYVNKKTGSRVAIFFSNEELAKEKGGKAKPEPEEE